MMLIASGGLEKSGNLYNLVSGHWLACLMAEDWPVLLFSDSIPTDLTLM